MAAPSEVIKIAVDLTALSNTGSITSAIQTYETVLATAALTGPRGKEGPAGPGLAAGGLTGQVPKKASNADYDTAWSTLTSSDVGLSNVNNTSDANKPISTATQTALNGKSNVGHTHSSSQITDFDEAVEDKIGTKVVAGSNVTVTYDDVSGNTTISSAGGAVTDGDKGDITVASSGSSWTIDNGAVTNSKVASGIDAAKIGGGLVSNTEYGYLDGVTSALQGQLNTKVQIGGDIGGTITSPTVKNRLRVFDVRDYGAVADGTTNDRAAIQLAIDAAAALGGVVYLGPGTYYITASLILKSRVSIHGAGRGISILTGAATDFTLVQTTKSGTAKDLYNSVEVYGLTFKSAYGSCLVTHNTDGVKVHDNEFYFTSTTPIRQTYFAQHCRNVEVWGNYVHDYTGNGLSVTSTDTFRIYANTIFAGANGDDGIDVDYDFLDTAAIPSNYGQVFGNTVRNIGRGNGIRIENSNWVSVFGNTVDTVSPATGITGGILINSSTSNTLKHVSVTGNTVSNCVTGGIIADGTNATEIVIVGNTVEDCGANGGSNPRGAIILSAAGVLCANNTIDGMTKTGTDGGGILVYKKDNHTITGNIIKNCVTGLRLWNGDGAQTYAGLQVNGNRFDSNTTNSVISAATATSRFFNNYGLADFSAPPAGLAGGDLTGNYPNPVLRNVARSINVMDYGAAGDNVADDTSAWQNALNAAYLTGSRVWAPSKTFKITAQLTVQSGVVISTDVGATLKPTSNFYCLFYSGATTVVIEGLTIDGSANTNNASCTSVRLLNCKEIWIDRCRIIKSAGFGIFLQANGTNTTERAVISRTILSGQGNNDVIGGGGTNSTSNYVNDVIITNCFIDQDCTTNNYQNVFDIVASKRLILTGNNVQGIVEPGFEQFPHNGIVISGNHVRPALGKTTTKILVDVTSTSTVSSKNLVIANNEVYNGEINVIGLAAYKFQYVTITGNTVDTTSITNGINLQYVSGAQVTGNIINGAASCVRTEGCDNVGISANTFTNSSYGVNDVSGVASVAIGQNTYSNIVNKNVGGGAATHSDIAFYNTLDQVTNFERMYVGWASNVFKMLVGSGGTGTTRQMQVGTVADYITFDSGASYKISIGQAGRLTGNNLVNFPGTLNSSSAQQIVAGFTPTINQSGTAGYDALAFDITETATGSGEKNFLNMKLAGVSKFKVSNSGAITGVGTNLTGVPQTAVTNLTSDLALKAPLASPALTGTPTTPTAAPGTSNSQIASTAFAATAATNAAANAPSSQALVKTHTQTGHGFTVGQPIRNNGTAWVTAQANTATNAEAVGLVFAVIDANTFQIIEAGYLTGWTHGLAVGLAAFLSPTSAGTLTSTEPTTVGQVSKPMFIPDSTTSGYVINYRGITVSAPAYTLGIGGTASTASPTPTGDSRENEYYLTALATGATFGAPSGTPANGNKLVIRVKDNGSAQTLAYNAIYRAIGFTLPTTTVAGKTMYLGGKYNSADSKWDIMAYKVES